jgi:hypothetical protein
MTLANAEWFACDEGGNEKPNHSAVEATESLFRAMRRCSSVPCGLAATRKRQKSAARIAPHLVEPPNIG